MFFPPDGSKLEDISVELTFTDTASDLIKGSIKATGIIAISNPTLDITKWLQINFNSNNDFEFYFDKNFNFDFDFSKTVCKLAVDHPKIKFGYIIRDVPKTSILLFLKEKSFDFNILLQTPKNVEYFLTKKPIN